jgi:hypothetical protein
MTLAVAPSITHSKVVFGPMWSCFLIFAGTEICPRLDILVRMNDKLHDLSDHRKEIDHFTSSLISKPCNHVRRRLTQARNPETLLPVAG